MGSTSSSRKKSDANFALKISVILSIALLIAMLISFCLQKQNENILWKAISIIFPEAIDPITTMSILGTMASIFALLVIITRPSE